ncbi:MAG: hypothetical protein U0230_02305 [Polyangiales bacterium]
MSALTSLLARDQVVPVKKIEEAIQRQVISGGDLATALLEVGAAAENVLCAYVAATHGLIPATRDEVMRVPRDVVRLVPREVAEKHRLVPLAVEGRTLVVGLVAPLSAEDEQQLSFLLGMTLVARIVTEPRVAAALAQYYDVAMASRMRRLVEKLKSQDAGIVPIVSPFSDNRVDRSPGHATASVAPSGSGHASAYARGAESGGNTARYGNVAVTRDSQIPSKSGASASVVNVSRVVGVSEAPPRRSSAPPPANAAPAPEPVATNLAPTKDAKAPEPLRAPRSELLAAHQGALTADEAIKKLGEAQTRDDVLHVAFRFLQQDFAFSALFTVHDEEADGLDVHGDGLTEEEIHRISLKLDTPGTARDVRDFLGARVSTLDATDSDRELAEALRRQKCQPSVVLPVVIRQRVVVLVYGDRGGKDFGLADLPDVLAFLPRVSEALQRLILQKKKGGSSLPAGGPIAAMADRGAQKSWGAGAASPSPEATPAEAAPSEAASSSTAPATIALPTGRSSAPSESALPLGDATKGSQRPAAFDLLGVPRAAPMPPMEMEAAVAAAAESHPESTPPEASPEAPEAPVGPSASETAASTTSVDDDEPELTIADEPAQAQRPISSTSYHFSGGSEEVVVQPRRGSMRPTGASQIPQASARPSEAARSRRADPRRETDEGIAPDVLRVQKAPQVVEEASIITSIGTSVDALVDELCATGPDDLEEPLRRLLEVGDSAIPVLARRFPGPLWFDRRLPHKKAPRGRDISAVARALSVYRERAVPHILTLLENRDADVRYYATLLATEFSHRDLVVPLGRRLFEPEAQTRAQAIEALRGYRKFARELQDVLDAVRVVAGNEKSEVERRVSAVRILGELRDDRAVELLVDLLGDGAASVAQQAHRSLVLITRQDFGTDAARWEPWVESNGDRHRIEWLIDSLLHPDEEIRRAASEELKALTQEYFGYHPAAPKKDRELAHRKYRQWWEQHGSQRFSVPNAV